MGNKAFCKCEGKDLKGNDCNVKDSCLRFKSEHETVINYPIISDSKKRCTWYIKDKSVEVGDE